MKVLITLWLTLALSFTGMGAAARVQYEAGANDIMSHVYPLCGIVIEVNHAEDYIAIEDFTGNVWEWEGAEDWHEGDIAAMIMHDNNTKIIYDDIIMDIAYNGWVE